ncbi:fluoride efflux transporter CrcB [Aphanothece sacrum]|uniref:Fluoride-specific ion channel FluC n=1 Tax=Aphanothece sacrum FPU1 TaxID=1920663 RepID=A0A401IK58_APHSA|nr:fluoride efflux transporter CrcB [Aphanothece sacrum]GBF81606.1 chromosome condensation protein CrcB [Aphanothece sacrum FPU1]GBF84136.1 chromosome condensation protein CrcB [Aphanothece sacrum FPU3]
MQLLQLILVFVGGGLGSVSRFFLSLVISSNLVTPFPWGTLTVNILGCFIIGIVIGIIERYQLNPYWTLLFATGFCGGFTTFSSFSYENNLLVKNSEYFLALVYILISVFWGFAATFLAMFMVRKF